ncbi:dCTP deaminase [Candidatus Peregrinibacteria bacterium RIFCSPLOWO2_02_FULL_48_14]|nr:MAG: dCTP deaminase [Candidatus Peregrinibacteria bacterium RIFCSPLOWO2_01_FULL_48_20]OGJ44607.1 MAG: dCTP deaminase [Candidatus Peregrinibacteria bacterium RIFCSPLOWO2_02_FULL_48_14]
MILSDRDIKKALKAGRIAVESPGSDHEANIHASSLDLRLGKYFKVYEHSKFAVLDPLKMDSFKGLTKMVEITTPEEPFIVHPGDFVLGVTLESVKLGDDIVARVEGRSSLGRLGIIVHSTAGFIDAGFEGSITLEITNINRMPVALYPGMRVCQLAFEEMTSPAEVPYNKKASSKYQGQKLPEESRLSMDPEFQKGMFVA